MPFEWVEPTRTKFLRLAEPASMSIKYSCRTCLVDLEHDEDLYCPSCGTYWSSYHGDGDRGELDIDAWGEDRFEGTITPNEDAHERGDEAVRKYVYKPNRVT